jgi:phosphosulfolactate phosphohydrolase-like enzyme
MSSDNSQVIFDKLSIRKLHNNVEGISIFDFSNSNVMINNSIMQDIQVQMKSSNGAEIIHLRSQT